MMSLLLSVIYLAFISLGLPDGLLGAGWPNMYPELGAPVGLAGVISVIISLGTVVASVNANRLIARFGTGVVTACSVGLTALALFGFSISTAFWMLCVWAIPYGLGAGAVDSALNNFVALHYASKHMSWLHCFWGIGASTGPLIMGWFLINGHSWRAGYSSIGCLQVVLTVLLVFTLPWWKRALSREGAPETKRVVLTLRQIMGLEGAKPVMAGFFCYCGLEVTTGLWAASYLTLHRGIDAKTAATWASLYFAGMTLGRLLSGFITERMGDKNLIRLGQAGALLGVIMILLPLPNAVALWGLVTLGLGSAPIYPSIIHATPNNFGRDKSQALVGVQMAAAYLGTMILPPCFGLLAQQLGIGLFPAYLLILIGGMALFMERLNTLATRRQST